MVVYGKASGDGSGQSVVIGGTGVRRAMSILLALVLVAFVSRIWQLDAQSLRGDEAFDVVFARRPVPEILHELRATQPYPPLFHLFFKGWMRIAGYSVFALRFPSVFCSVLCIPLVYVLAQLWCGQRAALWAAFLMTWQPLAIWYAQDGRMYAALMLFPLASTCFAAYLWKGQRKGWLWAGYIATALLGLMTHYMAFPALFAQNVCAVFVAWGDRDLRLLVRWILAQMVTGLLYVPWIAFAFHLLRSHTSSWVEPTSVPMMLWRGLKAYTVGLTLDPRWTWVVAAASGLGLVVGMVTLWRAKERRAMWLIAITIAAPIGLIVLASASRPAFDERYLVFLVAPILILVGRGLSELRARPWVQIVLTVLIVGGMWSANVHYRLDPAYAKSRPWRQLFDYLQARIQEGDVIVYTFPDPAPEVYTEGRWPILILPSSFPPDEGDLSTRVTQLAASYERVWLIPQWSPAWDEAGLVQDVLDRQCERAAEVGTASWPLVVYHTPRLYRKEMTPLDVSFGRDVRLLGYALRDDTGRAVEQLDLDPVETARLTLYWQADSPIGDNYIVFTHLLGPAGRLYGQQDNQPRQGTFPTKAWPPGEWIVDTYQIPVAVDASAGEYSIEAGMYRPSDGTRLVVRGADSDPEQRRVLLRGCVRVR
jgi:4-amino-4-deoxy-L-arabinose transferase-like glycosyltransferase